MLLDRHQVNVPRNKSSFLFKNLELTLNKVKNLSFKNGICITSNLCLSLLGSESSSSDAIVFSLALSFRILVLSQSLLATTMAM